MSRDQMSIRFREARGTYVFDVYEEVTDPESGRKRMKKRLRSFATKKAAEEARAAILEERREFGRRAERLRPEERIAVLGLRDQVARIGATLEEAVEFFLKHRAAGAKRVSVARAVEEYVADRERDLSHKTLRNYLHTWRLFGSAGGFGERCLDTITTAEISEWLRSNGWAPRSQMSYRTNLSLLFEWAAQPKRGYVRSNPVAGAEIDRLKKEGDVARFTVEQCRTYLRSAALMDPEFVPGVVLSLFAGLRPEELAYAEKMEGSGMDPVYATDDACELVVQGAKRRSRRRRLIRLEPVAQAWLARYAMRCPVWPVDQRNVRKRWEAIRPEPWIQDGPRHTFGTMHVAAFRDERRLQMELGHWSGDLLYAHYRGLASEVEAREFWNLTPEVVLGEVG